MITDDQVLARLGSACRLGRRLDVRVILLLIEVEDRRLHLRRAYPSLFEFCRGELGMSEGTANRRVAAAKLVRRMPLLVRHLEQGTLTLSALMLIRNVITESNVDVLVASVAGKKMKQVEELVACMAPKPDVPAQLVALPTPSESAGDVGTSGASTDAPTARRTDARARLAPLAESRWHLQLTADQSLHDKIERASELMRHRNPGGDLTVVVAAAFDALLQKLEAPRKERPSAPPRRRRANKPGAIAAATRAAVFARDGEQCTYEDVRGRRCPSTTSLQIDHIDARARGGSGDLANLRVRCWGHNKLHAEEDFGRDHIEARIQERERKRHGSASEARRERRAGPNVAAAAAHKEGPTAARSRASKEPRAG